MLSKSVGFYIFISRQKLITLLSMQLIKHYSQHQMYVCINYFDFKNNQNNQKSTPQKWCCLWVGPARKCGPPALVDNQKAKSTTQALPSYEHRAYFEARSGWVDWL